MANKLASRYSKPIWEWTLKRLTSKRLTSVHEVLSKPFSEWPISMKNIFTRDSDKGEDIPIYTGSLGIALELIDADIDALKVSAGGGAYYTHVQATSSTEWNITHNLGYNPSITVVDSSGINSSGDITYLDVNSCKINFNIPIAGEAYLS